MKIKLLILLCLWFITSNAQTTHDLNWERFSLSPSTDLTIDVGDTVRWTWTDAFPHTVENNVGSTETFDSNQLTGLGMQFSYTFTLLGTNPYLCGVHGAANMSGTITVQTLGIDDFAQKGFAISPNPARSRLVLKLPNGLNKVNVEVFDVLGKEIYNNKFKSTPIDISGWSRGVYMVRVTADDVVQIKRFIKQ